MTRPAAERYEINVSLVPGGAIVNVTSRTTGSMLWDAGLRWPLSPLGRLTCDDASRHAPGLSRRDIEAAIRHATYTAKKERSLA